MSKNLDCTQPGGMPWTQNRLGFIQQAYQEMFAAMFAANGLTGNTPYIIYGCAITRTLVTGTQYNYSIAAGWMWYEGNAIRVPASGPVLVDESVNACYSLITTTATPLTFNNGSTPNVVEDVTISLQAQPIGTANSSDAFLMSEAVSVGVALGQAYRPGWATLAVATASGVGGVTGSIYYKKDTIANTLLLRFSLTVNDPYNLVAAPAATAYVIQTMPAGFYNSGHDIDFIIGVGAQDGSNNTVKDDAGVSWIRQAQVAISNTGDINIFLMKPAVGCTVYNVYGMVVLPLD